MHRTIGILLTILILTSGTIAQVEQVLRVGMVAPFTLDPALASNDPEVLINRHLYNYLVDVSPSGELLPSLADSWTISADRLTYTFRLVDDATFHDGSPFTAADVVYTFNRLIDVGASPVDIMGLDITEDTNGNRIETPTWTVIALSDYVVEFQLDAPNEDFLYGISSRFASIIPDGATSPNQLQDDVLSNVNGTGAFRLESYDSTSAILVANQDYWQAPPMLDRIEFIFISDQNDQIDALLNGTVDFIFKIPNASVPDILFSDSVTLISVDTNTHPAIRLRSDVGHLGEDVRIRQAFKHATDRELLNVFTLNGLGIVGNNDPIGPIYGDLYQTADTLAYDPDRACELLTDYATQFPDNVWVTIDDNEPRLEVDFFVVDAFEYAELAEYAADQWQDGCIHVNIEIRPENAYYGNGEWFEVELGLTGWGTRVTAQEYLNVGYVTGAPLNETHWSNPELDALVELAQQADSLTQRIAIYDQIRQIFVNEGPVIIPFFTPVHGAYNNRVIGIEMYPFPGSTNFYNVDIQ